MSDGLISGGIGFRRSTAIPVEQETNHGDSSAHPSTLRAMRGSFESGACPPLSSLVGHRSLNRMPMK